MLTIDPRDVWDYFENNKDLLATNPEVIAENLLNGVEIELDVDAGLPVFRVYYQDREIYAELCGSSEYCKETVERLYDQFLDSWGDLPETEVSAEQVFETEYDEVVDREDALEDAVYEMLHVFAPNIDELVSDISETISITEFLKNFIGAYLYDEHGISVYRPMFLKNDNGEDEYVEFPYPKLMPR